MGNFVGTLLSIFLHFFLVFLMLSFILILYKLDNSYICPLDKNVMSRHKLSTMFDTLGQIAAEILVTFRYTTLFFSDFYLNSIFFINIHEYVNEKLCISNHYKTNCVLVIIWHQVCYFRAISSRDISNFVGNPF